MSAIHFTRNMTRVQIIERNGKPAFYLVPADPARQRSTRGLPVHG